VINVFVYRSGETTRVERVERKWLDPSSDAILWVDLEGPPDEAKPVLADTFHFHPLAIEDALAEIHHPKIELYNGVMYLILHGIAFQKRQHRFETQDVDFFLGRNFLVTVHRAPSRSISKLRDVCDKNSNILGEGPVGLLHRIVDSMVDHYRPEIEGVEQRVEKMEHEAVLGVKESLVKEILALKRDLSSLRRVVVPQRDVVGRLARREFPMISDEMAYRFRDVYDHLVRLSEEAVLFQDRVNSILEAHLSTVSNRLNQVVKVLTVMSTIFLPLTVLTGLWGMNVPLPHFPGGDTAQFWWVVAIMAALSGTMLGFFRSKGWI